MSSKYNVENDDYFKNFISKPTRNENTANKYKKLFTKLCKATNSSLEEIITTCIDEQNIVTTVKLPPDENGNERRREIKFNINNKDAAVNKYLNQYEDYCRQRNNKNTTIQSETDLIRTFLNEYGVILPKRKNYENDANEWYLPTKEELNYILEDFSLVHTALGNFLTSTGMRIGDAVSLTIGDFMKATAEYHDYIDVEDFIDNAPEDMIGQWVFEPHKTRRHKTKCITFNTTHASNLILQHLRNLKNQYIPNKNKRDNLNLKINKNYPLFGSKQNKYQIAILAKSVTTEWYKRNKKFKAWKIKQIKQQIKDGELSSEDYDEAVSKIPKLHPHMCRKFFSTIVSNNCGDIRVCALLEGHSDGLPNDKSYIKKKVKDIKEIYINGLHDALSLANVETKIITNKKTEELNKKISEADEKIEALTNENAEKDKEIEELKSQLQQTNKIVKDLDKKIEQSQTNIPFHKVHDVIFSYLTDINELDNDRISLLNLMVLDYAKKHSNEFKSTPEYLYDLIRQLDIQIELSNKTLSEQKTELLKSMEFEKIDQRMIMFIDELLSIIKNNPGIMKRIGTVDMIKFDYIAEEYLTQLDINLETHISDEEKIRIANDILMEYLKS